MSERPLDYEPRRKRPPARRALLIVGMAMTLGGVMMLAYGEWFFGSPFEQVTAIVWANVCMVLIVTGVFLVSRASVRR